MIIDELNTELTVITKQHTLPSATQGKTLSTGSDLGSSTKIPETKEETKSDASDHKMSAMDDLFGGELCTTVLCNECGNTTDRKETFYYLSLPLPPEVKAYRISYRMP